MIKFFLFSLFSNATFLSFAEDTLFLEHRGKEIVVIEGKQHKYYDLYLNVWDSILSGESTDENEVYINISVRIDRNPFTGEYSILWITQGGRIFQSVEVDCLKNGCGVYNYWSESNYGSGFLKRGMKNGIETEIEKDVITKTPFHDGFISGTMYRYSLIYGHMYEQFYVRNIRDNYSIWYKFEGSLLNFFDYVGDSKFNEGLNKFYSKERKSEMLFEVRDGKIVGDIIIKDKKDKKQTFHVFK